MVKSESKTSLSSPFVIHSYNVVEQTLGKKYKVGTEDIFVYPFLSRTTYFVAIGFTFDVHCYLIRE